MANVTLLRHIAHSRTIEKSKKQLSDENVRVLEQKI